jgi:hypothetical protein
MLQAAGGSGTRAGRGWFGFVWAGGERRKEATLGRSRARAIDESIQVLLADGDPMIGDELPKLSFVVCLGALDGRHVHRLFWTRVLGGRLTLSTY